MPRLCFPTDRRPPLPSPRLTIALAAIVLAAGVTTVSKRRARSTGLTLPNPNQPGPTGPVDRPDGVAEQAPKEKDLLPTVPVLPPERSRKKAFELSSSTATSASAAIGSRSFTSVLIRPPRPAEHRSSTARLHPDGRSHQTVRGRYQGGQHTTAPRADHQHQREDTRSHASRCSRQRRSPARRPIQFFADGTSPRGDRISGAFSDGQVAPVSNRNAQSESLRVKRAWAEVETSFGLIQVRTHARPLGPRHARQLGR